MHKETVRLLNSQDSASDACSPWTAKRKRVYGVLFGGCSPWDRYFGIFIIVLIMLNVIAFILSTHKNLPRYLVIGLLYFDLISEIIFTAEYFLRIWSCIEDDKYATYGPVKGRLRFMFRFTSLLDFLSTIPYWVALAITRSLSQQFFGAIRLIRIFTILKVERYISAFSLLGSVFTNSKEILFITGGMGFIIWICTSTALYFAEHERNPEIFPDLSSTMYITLLLLTVLEAPDSELLSPAGKFIIGVSALFSIGVFALPVGIISWRYQEIGQKILESKRENITERRRVEGYQDDIDTYEAFSKSNEKLDTCPHCKRPF